MLIGNVNANFGVLGYPIVAFFAVSRVVSVAIFKWRRYDDLELKAELNEASPGLPASSG